MIKNIEFVCTGNSGRSPVAEVIAKDYLKSIGASNEYSATSSGTKVRQLQKDLPIKVMNPIINLGLERGIYRPAEVTEIQSAIEEENTEIVRGYFDRTCQTFIEEEVAYRKKILDELEVKSRVKQMREQTIPNSNSIAVLPMDSKNYKEVLSIFSNSVNMPIISVMSVLATGIQNAEIPNAFGKGGHDYRIVVEQIAKEVPEAVRRIIGA